MDYNIREALDSFDKQELIDLVIEHADNGFYPHELFLLKAHYPYSADSLKEMWESAYDRADQMEDDHDPHAADYLDFCAQGIYRYACELDDVTEKTEICKMLVTDLTCASEEDGIGMYSDSEWIYEETRDTIAAEQGI